ncbi:Protein BOBBER 2 [Linum grandiflorum]
MEQQHQQSLTFSNALQDQYGNKKKRKKKKRKNNSDVQQDQSKAERTVKGGVIGRDGFEAKMGLETERWVSWIKKTEKANPEYEEEDIGTKTASSSATSASTPPAKPSTFTAPFDPSNRIGLVEKLFDFVASESDFLSKDSAEKEIAAAVKSARERRSLPPRYRDSVMVINPELDLGEVDFRFDESSTKSSPSPTNPYPFLPPYSPINPRRRRLAKPPINPLQKELPPAVEPCSVIAQCRRRRLL